MSSKAEEEEADKDVCANCGIAEIDEIKLEDCDGCDLVKYCSDKCREEHREQHTEDCKKRADELHVKRLFTQPEGSHRGECPICFLPMPLDARKTLFMECCGQWICTGCGTAHMMTNVHDRVESATCALCRTLTSDEEEYRKRTKERIEANYPPSLFYKGSTHYNEGDYDGAFEYYTKAAELGDAEAHYRLGRMYWEGEGVVEDNEKAVYHYEKAAIGGHPTARYMLGLHEGANGEVDRTVMHWTIAANLGCEYSMKQLLPMYKDGFITKEEYGATLRTHQATIDATKSAQRDEAERVKAFSDALHDDGELHDDDDLFTQPDGSHHGECPICFLPMPLDADKSSFMACCGQTICNGCIHASYVSNIHDKVKASTCVFCRTPTSDKQEYEKRTQERIEANDPAALRYRGTTSYNKGNFRKALKYLTKASELGNIEAYYYLGCMYMYGEGVEKDMEKAIYHWEKAAIGGHHTARHNLAVEEAKNGNVKKAVKHWIIAAKLGYDVSMKALLPSYKGGYITKDEYGATLRAHQAAVDATKSSQREAAERIGL